MRTLGERCPRLPRVNIHDDFEEFLRLFAEKGVEFVVVGGYAVVGAPGGYQAFCRRS